MRSILFSALLFAFLGTYSVNGQVDFFNSAEETARQLDAMEGRDTPQRRENREANRNNNNNSRANNEAMLQWERLFGTRMAAFKEGMDYFNTPETRCLFIMVIYVDTYLDIVESTDNERDSRTKCDGYALQLVAIPAMTSIMYCPESLTKKTGPEKYRIWHNDLKPILENEDNRQTIINWKQKLDRITNEADPASERINDIAAYFRPEFVVNQLISIQQNMEELNCTD